MLHGLRVITMTNEIIVITGPESCGKTTLAGQLANRWKAPLVSEVARKYLEGKDSYEKSDLLEIAKLQYQMEQKKAESSTEKLVCDTDLLVILIWSEVRYGSCDPWIYRTFEKCLEQKSYTRRYILCDPKIPWQPDRLRENSHNRDELFAIYLKKLIGYRANYSIVQGKPNERLQQAAEC